MMDELIQKVTQKTGISNEQAQDVMNVVMSHLKEKLPGPLASALEGHLFGGSAEDATTGGGIADKAKAVASGLGSLFGKTSE